MFESDWKGDGEAVVLYSNHSSWWDPLTGAMVSSALFPERVCYAPIDAMALKKYPLLERVGLFPVDRQSRVGGRAFIEACAAIVSSPSCCLWLTPQGRFADVRERPLAFDSGIAYLAKKYPDATYIPVAIEYVLWEEPLPELLIWVGEPERMALKERARAADLNLELEARLTIAMDRLRDVSVSRDSRPFLELHRGRSGINRGYDFWRSRRNQAAFQDSRLEHGTK